MAPKRTLQLSTAKATLSEVVRSVRKTGQSVVITVDGEPVVELIPALATPQPLSLSEVATYRALSAALARVPRQKGSFDAVALVAEGRR